MFGNDRLYLAVVALATEQYDVRSRVVLAMNIMEPLSRNEFKQDLEIWNRLEKIKKETSKNGALIINGRFIKDAYANTASSKNNSTYKKYAKEIFNIWLETCK